MQQSSGNNRSLFGGPSGFRLAFWTGALIYLMVQARRVGGVFSYLTLPDNDDAMRLVSVLDFLGGQGWYDMVQHRAMPPEGLSMHWSRLVDLPLAGLVWFFDLFASRDIALALTAAVWPMLLFFVFLVITGRVARQVFGYSAAAFAVIAAGAMPMLSSSVFPVGRVDHNNVQLICMLLAISAAIMPGKPTLRGIIGGLAAAVSLAVGLETIVVLALVGIVLSVQHVLDHPGATDRLLGYGIALGGAAPLLFLIQTDPALWELSRCDQLSRTTLVLTGSAMAFSVIVYLSREMVVSTRSRLLLTGGLIALVLVALWPVLSPCREGPFSVLPPKVRDLILGNITESLSEMRMFAKDPRLATQLLFPPLLVALLLGLFVLGGPGPGRRPAAVLLVFVLLGLAGLFYQVRTVIWGLAAMPLAFGVGISWAANSHWRSLRRSKPVLLVIATILILYPHILTGSTLFAALLKNDVQGEERKLSLADKNCSRRDGLAALNGISPAGILAPLNLGTKILLFTPHSIFAAPYHRAPEAYWNGTLAFMGGDKDMAQRLRATGADYVLVCSGETYASQNSIGSRLARGEVPGWLQQVDIGDGPARLLEVKRDELKRFLNGG
ncbi:MAG: hypothetical protein R3256_04460 [Thalassovita sp.]|nr:hypothetical protein [Thalassovita sp.]